MAFDPIFNIDESDSKFELSKLSSASDEAMLLAGKQLQLFQYFSEYWKGRLEIGKKCMNYARRDIFTPGQRRKYMNVDEKWPIEPQEMKPVINALAAQITSRVRSGRITMEDGNPPANVAPAEDFNVVVKWMETQLKLDRKQKKALRSALINGYPHFLLFDRKVVRKDTLGNPSATLLPWDSVLPSPRFLDDFGEDIHELIIVHKKTKAELLDMFPNRKNAFNEHDTMLKDDPGHYSQLLTEKHGDQSAEHRNNQFFDMIMGPSLSEGTGVYTIIQRIFDIKKNRTVYYNPETEDPVTLPTTWDEARISNWKRMNPGYSLEHNDDVSTLWQTVTGLNGFIWDNEEHWLQEHPYDDPSRSLLPAIPLIPDMIDGIPIGAGEDMLPIILLKACCKTEGLSEVRRGGGTLNVYKEGTVVHPGKIRHEATQEEGVLIIKKSATIDDAYKRIQRRPNPTFFDMDDRLSQELRETHNINPAVTGQHASRQSDRAKLREIDQSMTPQNPYIESYTIFTHACTQMICHIIPYFMNEQRIITIEDEFGKPKSTEINVTDFDAEGKAFVIANDVTSSKYRVVATVGDDSPTSREEDMKEFVELLEAIGNTLLQMDPVFLAQFLSTLPNRYAQDAGKFMMENAERTQQANAQSAQAESELETRKLDDRKEIEMAKIMTPRLMMKADSVDIQEAPMGFRIFAQYVNALQSKTAGQQQVAQAGQEAIEQIPTEGQPVPDSQMAPA